jgi:hypothetical protein
LISAMRLRRWPLGAGRGQRDGAARSSGAPACRAPGLGLFSKFYFSDTIVSDSKIYGTIGAIFGVMTWFIAIGAVIILGAVAGAVWEDRRRRHVPGTMTGP